MLVWLFLAALVTTANAQALLPWFSLFPDITQQPKDVAIYETEPFALRISTTGSRSIQWYHNISGVWVALPGQDSEVLEVKSATLGNAGEYMASVQGYLGSVDSNIAYVTVHASPSQVFIYRQPPASVVVTSNSPQTLVVEAKSVTNITYQWFRDGVPSVCGPEVVLNNLTAAGKTFWKCEICDEHTCVTSLTVAVNSLNEFLPPWPKQLERGARERTVLVKGTRPYPDHDDLTVSCLFKHSTASVAYRTEQAFVTYDESDVPMVFCEFPSGDAELGEYTLSIQIGMDVTVIQDPCIHLFTSKSLKIRGQNSFHVDRLTPFFNFSLFGDFHLFTIGQTADGIIGPDNFLFADTEPIATLICSVCSASELICTLERVPVSSGRLFLSFNRLEYFDTEFTPTVNFDVPAFESVTPRTGPISGGFEIALEGFSFEYSGQAVSCIFEVPGSGFRHSVPGNALTDKITCKAPPFPFSSTINIFVQLDQWTIPVAPVFHYTDFSLSHVFPRFLPVTPSDGVTLPNWLHARSAAFFNLLGDNILPKSERDLLKLNTFFVFGRGFPVGSVPSVYIGRTPIALVAPQSNCECAVFDTERLICRVLQDVDVGTNQLFVSFNNFFTWESVSIDTFTINGVTDLTVRPYMSSLTRLSNLVMLETNELPHGLISSTGAVCRVRLHIPQLTTRAMPCDVTSSRTLSCSIPKAPATLSSQSMELFISVGTSVRYRLKSSLQFVQRLWVASIDPPVWHSYGGQQVALSFRQPLPEAHFTVFLSGDGLDCPIACRDVVRSPVSEAGSPLPNNLLFTIPPILGNVTNISVTVFADGVNLDVGFEVHPMVYNPFADGIAPYSFDVRSANDVCVFGHGFSRELLAGTVLKISWNPENTLTFRGVAANWTHVCFRVHGINTPVNTFTGALAMLSLDNGATFWNMKYGAIVLRNVDFGSVELTHAVGQRGDGASILTISNIPDELLAKASNPSVRLFGLMEGTGRFKSMSRCQLQHSNVVCRLAPLPYPCSLELSLDGDDFISIPNKFLNPTSVNK